ncbi:uncharacterized protein [Magallana gigas]|uniref:uncharacterized protein n=1 Tax=Magallana gigas TaxID=29159 RepID=UPI00334085B1
MRKFFKMKMKSMWIRFCFLALNFLINMTEGNSDKRATLNLTSLCKDEAFFGVSENLIGNKCTITFNLSQNRSNPLPVVYRFFLNSSVFRVPLDTAPPTKTLYNVVLTCILYKPIRYIPTELTGECLKDQNVATTPESEVIYKPRTIFSSSVQDIVLGIVFSVFALSIVFVTVYYQYRRYRRRRRMQQYLSTPHTDPFERLQDHMEE